MHTKVAYGQVSPVRDTWGPRLGMERLDSCLSLFREATVSKMLNMD